jgi:hypothetical protein
LLGTGTTVLLDMGLHRFGVASGMNYVTHRDVSMVCCCFVASRLMMLGSFLVMTSRMRKVLKLVCGVL